MTIKHNQGTSTQTDKHMANNLSTPLIRDHDQHDPSPRSPSLNYVHTHSHSTHLHPNDAASIASSSSASAAAAAAAAAIGGGGGGGGGKANTTGIPPTLRSSRLYYDTCSTASSSPSSTAYDSHSPGVPLVSFADNRGEGIHWHNRRHPRVTTWSKQPLRVWDGPHIVSYNAKLLSTYDFFIRVGTVFDFRHRWVWIQVSAAQCAVRSVICDMCSV